MSYILHVLVMYCLYSMLALSLNLVVGYGGMLSLCHAAFYGIGAYATALLVRSAGWPWVLALAAAITLAGVTAELVARASLRFHGDFFVLATMGYQVITFSILYNWTSLTNGAFGISSVPKPSFLGFAVTSVRGLLGVAVVAAALVWLVSWRLGRSAYGRALQAVRDDEIAAQSLGKDVGLLRRSSFVIAAMIAALAGALYGGYASYIDPTSFSIDESILVLTAVIVGGAGNVRGPLVGAATVVLLPEFLRFVYLPDAVAANARQILYGLLLILLMRFRPQGIAGRYSLD